MSEQQPRNTEADIETLLRIAGPRRAIPVEVRHRVHESVRGEWRRTIHRRSSRRWAWTAVAAIVAIIGFLLAPRLRQGQPNDPISSIGRVVVVDDTLVIVSPDGMSRIASAGKDVMPDQTLQTSDEGGASLLLSGGSSLRLDRNTRLRVMDRTTFSLDRGAVYLDADPLLPSSAVVIRAGDAEVRESGTQFEVRRNEDSTRVRVREGRVTIHRRGSIHDAGRGEQIELHADGDVIRRTIPPDDDSWTWVQNLAPPLPIEGRTLLSYLGWVSRETGLEIRYDDPIEELDSTSIVLHGSILGMTPAQSLDAVLPTCGLTHDVYDGHLVIERAGRGGR